MRYRLAALMLMAVLLLMSAMNLPAAPIPDPSAVLDIGPPRKGKTADAYCKDQIHRLSNPRSHYLWCIENIDEVKKLASDAHLKEKEVVPWLAKNLRIKEEEGGRRLRFSFRAGTRAEQVAILNALLRGYMGDVKQTIKTHEGVLQPYDEQAARYAKLAKEERDPEKRAHLEELTENAKAALERRKAAVPNVLAEIDRLKQIKVIKWAK